MPTMSKIVRKGLHPDADPHYPGHGYRRTVVDGMIFERDVEVTLRDGTLIYIDVFRPDRPGRFPVVLGWAPFGKHPHVDWDRDFPGADVPPGNSPLTAFESPDPVRWTSNDFVIVTADPRGIRYSEGVAEFMTAQEGRDEYDLIEWLAVQEWSNGNIGTNGVSYFSMSAYQAAALKPPHLKAVILFEALTDFYRDVKLHGGIPCRVAHGWMRSVAWSLGYVEDLESAVREHPLYDDYWTSRVADLSRIDVPALVVSSWANHGIHTRGTIEAWNEISSTQKWLDLHAKKEWSYFYQPESVARQMAFFNRFLRGDENALDDWAPVTVQVRERYGVVRHRESEAYPIPGTVFRELHLDADGRSLTHAVPPAEASVEYDARTGQADFHHVFEQRTELIGPAALRLRVSLKGSDDADLFIALRKLDRDGNEVNFEYLGYFDNGKVALGWLRLSHRELDSERSTPERPRPLHVRESRIYEDGPVTADIPILDSGTVFEEGESLVLTVAGHDLIDGYGHPMAIRHLETRNDGRHILHTGPAAGSRLLIPVAPSDDGDPQHPHPRHR